MKVLLLSPYENGIQNFIESNGDIVYKTSGLVSMPSWLGNKWALRKLVIDTPSKKL